MSRIKLFLCAIGALVVFGSLAASSASAAATSTSVLLLSGGAFPVKFSSLPADNPTNRIFSELQSSAGGLKGLGFLLQGEITKATGGLYEVLFLNVTTSLNEKCSTNGERVEGEVLVPQGNFTIVHDVSSSSGVGVLFEVKEFEIKCGTLVKIKIRGNVLGLLLPAIREILWEGGGGSLECAVAGGTGTPKETKYWTSLLESELTAKLESNFGTGFKASCELVEPEEGRTGDIKIDVNQMIELME